MTTFSNSGSGNENAIEGRGVDGIGVFGESASSEGMRGVSHSAHGAVVGVNDAPLPGGNGGWFESVAGEGVRGTSNNGNHGGIVGVNTVGGIAVYGTSDDSVGVWGTSVNHEGIHAETKSATTAAIAAYQLNQDSESAALYAKHAGNRTAAVFEGRVTISGDLSVAGFSVNQLNVRIQHLEQLVDDLIRRVGAGGGPGVGPVAIAPTLIQAELETDPERVAGNGRLLKVSGSGFQPAERVTLQITYRASQNVDPDTPRDVPTTADGLGRISYTSAVICGSDATRHPSWQIVAIGVTSAKRSNVVSAGC